MTSLPTPTSFQPTRRTGLNRTLLLQPGQPWHEQPAGRALGATSQLPDDAWLAGLRRLLRTLTAPRPEDRVARQEWSPGDSSPGEWARWAQVERIVLCGGVVARRRRALADAGQELLGGGSQIVIAPSPAEASLRGLASHQLAGHPPADPADHPVLLLDLGHTAVKAALSRPRGEVGRVHRQPVPWQPFDLTTWPPAAELLSVIAAAATAAGQKNASSARVAIANYVVDGRLDVDDTYGRLDELGPDPAEALTDALGLPVTLLVNDGAAAALAWTGGPPTAVISIGTSLGVGFAGGGDA
ncbi:hypothetical protein ACQBAT_10790 [Ornithinimicrobium sp. Y1847]|uniref:hypothetical protein n=1 Tax=unclassified Ornithinimicrobium TaxID=2615080 RepID=UPI003B67FA8F